MASNQQVGNIVYQVQMDVAQLLDAQRKVNDRLDKMDGGFKKVGASADKLSTGMNKVGVAIAAAFTIQTAQKVIDIADSMAILQARINRLSVDAADGANNMQRLSAIASTTGSSIADTAKLWETLTASLKEYGATNDQVIRVTETLQKIGTIGGSSAEEMSNALRQFGQSIAGGTVRAEEFNSILENMPELGRQIAKGLGMSLGELRQEMLAGKLTAEDALNAIQKQTESVDAEFAKLPVSVERAKNKLDVAFDTAIQKIDQAIGLTRTLSSLISSVADNLTLALNSYGELGNLEPLMKKQVDLQKELNDLQKDGKQWYETQLTYQAKLNEKRRELLQVEGELVNIRAKQKKPAEAGQKSETAPFSIPSGQTDKDAEKAAKAAAKAQKARETASAKAQREADKEIETNKRRLAQYQAIEEKEEEAAKAAKERADSFSGSLSPTQNVENQFQQQLTELENYALVYPQKIEQIEAMRKQIEDKYRQERLAAQWEEFSQMNAGTQVLANALDSMGSTASNAITGILTGSMSASDAMRSLASTVLNSVVNSFVQMGVDWVKSAIMGQTATVGAVAASTAAQTAGIASTTAVSTAAAATTTAAWTPAAIVASIGSFGGAAAIGIGAVLGALAMGVAGARKNGGPVSAGSMYRVGEGGAPELLQSGGKNYMIPGDGGKVISNADLQTSGGGNIQVSVVFNDYTSGSHSYDAQTSQDGNSLTIQAFILDMDQKGPMQQAITRNTTATSRATGG